MNSLLSRLFVSALVVAFPIAALADGDAAPGAVEDSFEQASLKDDLYGVLDDAAKEVRITFPATAGSRLGVDVKGDTSLGADAATGLSLTLCTEAGDEIVVAGTKADKSRDGKDEVRWKNAALDGTGLYVLILRVTGAGGYRVRLKGKLGKLKSVDTSETDLAQDGEATLEFDAMTGGTAKFKLTAPGKSRFAGEAVSVQTPDLTLLADVPGESRAKVPLDQDGLADQVGTFRLTFKNAGRRDGAWKAQVVSKPPKLVARTAYLEGNQTALVPVVTTLTPNKGVERDTALRVVATGRDFQRGAEVRLVRKGFDDILATDVDFVSDTEIAFTLNLDTKESDGKKSTGKWKLAIWNRPEYGVPDDRTTFDADSPAAGRRKSFKSLASGSVRLPDGVEKDTEVWFLDFNDAFQGDLNAMGLGSGDPRVRDFARGTVEGYVLAALRDLFRVNETNGNVNESDSVPVSFVLNEPTSVAGAPGETYNRIEIGGAWDTGDPLSEPLPWGAGLPDIGNGSREDLSVLDGAGARLGLGARTRVLDPGRADAHPDWVTAMSPLRTNGLTSTDEKYFTVTFRLDVPNQVARYGVIADQIERASREIAAIVAHHVAHSMGRPLGGDGPLASPTQAGNLWPERETLFFSGADAAALATAAAAHDLPGKSDSLRVRFFPLVSSQDVALVGDVSGRAYAEAGIPFRASWNFKGGRSNAQPTDYRVQYVVGSQIPLGMDLAFDTLSGTAPLTVNNTVYCGNLLFQLAVTDRVRDNVTFHLHTITIVPPSPWTGPAALQGVAATCRSQLLGGQ